MVHKIKLYILTLNKSINVILHWVKSHIGIRGNEIADLGANKAHSNDRSEVLPLDSSEFLISLRSNFRSFWLDAWHFKAQATNTGMFLLNLGATLSYNKLLFSIKNRRDQVLINGFRMGHIGVNSFEHFLLTCPSYNEARNNMIRKLQEANITQIDLPTLLLCTDINEPKKCTILSALITYLRATNRVARYF